MQDGERGKTEAISGNSVDYYPKQHLGEKRQSEEDLRGSVILLREYFMYGIQSVIGFEKKGEQINKE
jgi:hypothetical protein